MSACGIVSRVTPVHTAVRNCTRDEGRPFEVGNQVLISSHRKLLSSKAMVVNVAEKSGQDRDRIAKATASMARGSRESRTQDRTHCSRLRGWPGWFLAGALVEDTQH